MIASAAYQAGDPATVTARYRIHFEAGLARSGDLEKLMARMDSAFKRQGSAGIIKARAVEDRLVADSWARDGYDLMPRARAIKIPTLVLSSDRDFIPPAIAEHIATAIPNARLASLKNCGHFSYMECPDDVRSAVLAFYR
jgi:proline iminopeptidase